MAHNSGAGARQQWTVLHGRTRVRGVGRRRRGQRTVGGGAGAHYVPLWILSRKAFIKSPLPVNRNSVALPGRPAFGLRYLVRSIRYPSSTVQLRYRLTVIG